MWFEVKVNYEKMAQDGIVRKMTEVYLADALSHADAEMRVTSEMDAFTGGEFVVSGVRRMNITEAFFNSDDDRIFRAKVSLTTLDGRTGLERTRPVNMLVQASSIDEALAALHKEMKGTMAGYEIKSVSGTNITDVFLTQ